MISEFQLLSQKIEQLALLASQLRSENAELRLQMASLRAENLDAKERISYAYRQIANLIEKLPAEPEPPSEELAPELADGNASENANAISSPSSNANGNAAQGGA